jgi:hypothetical protein
LGCSAGSLSPAAAGAAKAVGGKNLNCVPALARPMPVAAVSLKNCRRLIIVLPPLGLLRMIDLLLSLRGQAEIE